MKKYNLIECFKPEEQEKAIKAGLQILKNDESNNEWNEKRNKLLSSKIDVTVFMVWFIENYPESVKIMKENPEYQERFK